MTQRIEELYSKVAAKLEMTAERVHAEIARIAFADPRKMLDAKGDLLPLAEMTDDAAAAIASIESKLDALPGKEHAALRTTLKKVRLWDKCQALALAAKMLGLIVDRSQVQTDAAPSVVVYIPDNGRDPDMVPNVPMVLKHGGRDNANGKSTEAAPTEAASPVSAVPEANPDAGT